METALLFERRSVDTVDDWQAAVEQLGRSSILWIDIERPDRRQVAALARCLDLSRDSVERLASPSGRPYFGDSGNYLHVTAVAPADDGPGCELVLVDCLVSEHWLVTARQGPIELVEEFRERAADGTGDTGRLDGLEFLATLLEWVLNGYLRAFARIEDELDELDAQAMKGSLDDAEAALRQLVELRGQIGSLRRALVSHREMLLALTRPELEEIATSDHAERFGELRVRLEQAIQGARDCRDAVAVSFDVLIARNEQRTNEIMKVLTLASVLLLPGALIAGVMGMNFKVGLFDHDFLFWVVVAGILGLAAATLGTARARKWI
jgi:magnesium transporter